MRLCSTTLTALKDVFTIDAMQPGQAAQAAGITYATAKRYYDLWSDEIKRSLESNLLPSLEESVKRTGKMRKSP
jgi:hypothetical protein